MFRLFALCAVLLAGCANVTAVPITAENPAPDGIRIYGTKPILIVQGGVAKIEYIPNFSEAYALRFNAFLAKNDSEVTISPNGTLTSIKINLDSTDAVSLAEGLVDNLVSEDTTQGNLTGSDVRVFDFVYADDGTVSLREISRGSIRTQSTRMQAARPVTNDQPAKGSLKPVDQ